MENARSGTFVIFGPKTTISIQPENFTGRPPEIRLHREQVLRGFKAFYRNLWPQKPPFQIGRAKRPIGWLPVYLHEPIQKRSTNLSYEGLFFLGQRNLGSSVKICRL